MCPGSSDQIYIVSYNIKWATTSWTYSSLNICVCESQRQTETEIIVPSHVVNLLGKPVVILHNAGHHSVRALHVEENLRGALVPQDDAHSF